VGPQLKKNLKEILRFLSGCSPLTFWYQVGWHSDKPGILLKGLSTQDPPFPNTIGGNSNFAPFTTKFVWGIAPLQYLRDL
jgi:hypothetical protein